MNPKQTSNHRQLSQKRIDEIFDSLPALGSQAYLDLVRRAPASELPAQVLVRAYRQLPPESLEAEATLGRLLGQNDRDGYLTPLWRAATRKLSHRDWFAVEDLVSDTIVEIIDTLGGPRGKGADTAWISYLYQRLEDAYRRRVGRRRERQDDERAEPALNESGEYVDVLDTVSNEAAAEAPWHGRVESNDVVWLEEFIARVLARIPDDRIREVAHDLFSANPSKMKVLEARYDVDRFQIGRWRDIARARIYAALQMQDERDIDISWLKAR